MLVVPVLGPLVEPSVLVVWTRGAGHGLVEDLVRCTETERLHRGTLHSSRRRRERAGQRERCNWRPGDAEA
eukprot:9647489-Heterocapsa_arctica.AAC.1